MNGHLIGKRENLGTQPNERLLVVKRARSSTNLFIVHQMERVFRLGKHNK